jgi:hypothetical protein
MTKITDTTSALRAPSWLRDSRESSPASTVLAASAPAAVASPYLDAALHPLDEAPELPDALPKDCVAAAHHEASNSWAHRLGLAGFGGLTLVATMLGGMCNTASAATPQIKQIDYSQQQSSENLAQKKDRVGSRPTTPSSTTRDKRATPSLEDGHVHVFGQDIGSVPQDVPGVEWQTYQGTQSGRSYSVDYPAGWKVTKIFNGVAIYNPTHPSTAALFQWNQGQGQMSPMGLVQTVLNQSRASNVEILSQNQQGPQATQMGALTSADCELTYTAEGQPLHAAFSTSVANVSTYVPFWTGNVVAVQSSAQHFNEDLPILKHIAASFTSQ